VASAIVPTSIVPAALLLVVADFVPGLGQPPEPPTWPTFG